MIGFCFEERRGLGVGFLFDERKMIWFSSMRARE